MRLEQLKYVVEIAKNNSMSIASEKLHIAQPSLSLAVRQLEEELGVTIFTRSKKGSFLTEEGAEVYQKSIYILETVNSLYALTPAVPQSYSTLRILSVAVFHSIFAKIYTDFLDKNIYVKQNTKILNAEIVNKEVANTNNDYDFILTTISTSQLTVHLKELSKHYHCYQIAENNISVMVSKNSPYASSKSITLSTLKKLPLIQFSDDETTDEFLCSIVEKHYKIRLNKVLTTSDFSNVSKYIESGKIFSLTTPFIQLGTHHAANKDKTTNYAVLVPLKEKIPISFVLLYKKDMELSSAHQHFLNAFIDNYPQAKKLN